ncbi:MAG: 50S ribosomal protein L18 [Gammaproteobacteria bacterium]|nr:50S ribosomal protein L18 [Gammaproteobacteria bacterium]
MDKKAARLRRAKRTRARIQQLDVNRLCIHRTPRHIYVQVIAPNGKVLASASTLDKSIKADVTYGGNVAAAKHIGKIIATRCQEVGVTKVAFDRSGFKYHGRIQALADAARENGLPI